MANVSFYRQTTGSTATGAITFDTTNKYIYLGDGTTAHKFDCHDTQNTAGGGDTSSKIYLVGRTAQSTGTTYTHDTAYVGTDGCLYSGGYKVITTDSYSEAEYGSGLCISVGYGQCDDLYVPKASSSKYGVAKIYTSGTTCYITTT